MNDTQIAYQAVIEAHQKVHDKPYVVSLGPDTHIFHVEEDDWRDAEFLAVNKNGHHFRMMRAGSPDAPMWKFIKTWSGTFAHADWMGRDNLLRPDVEVLIGLAGTGPQGKMSYETLCLLPREMTTGRKVVWREHIVDIRFGRPDDNEFTLYIPAGEDKSIPKKFDGKPWESREAAAWCQTNLNAPVGSLLTPAEASLLNLRESSALESSAAWGMF